MAGDQVDRSRLPIADPEFTGVANRTLEGSRPDWGLIGHVAPPEGAPNVLLVLIDDAGFGQPSAFGGPIASPALMGVAEEGVRYNRFHVTALCSPTRAALLTGRNHHAVGSGRSVSCPAVSPDTRRASPRTAHRSRRCSR